MKKTIIAIAATLAMASAFATNGNGHGGPTGSVTGTATSSAIGVVSTSSTVSGVNGTSYHGASASAQNMSGAGGAEFSGRNNGSVITGAGTLGTTSTNAFGSGTGSSFAGAEQAGYGKVTAVANVHSNTTSGQVTGVSEVGVNTWSTADVTNSGNALSGSIGGAINVTVASVHASNGSVGPMNGVVTNATGLTGGIDGVHTSGSATPGDSVDAGGGSGQYGSFDGTVTKTFSNGGSYH